MIENVPGAGGNIATDRVAKAAPDGDTLLLGAYGPFIIHPCLNRSCPSIRSRTSCRSRALLHAEHSGRQQRRAGEEPAELIALAKAQPGKLTFASAGVGTTQHIAGELFKSMGGIDIDHVPYRGIGVMPDVIGGTRDHGVRQNPATLPLAREGKVRALAVTSLKRTAAMPELPTMAESGFPGFEAIAWFALLAPAGTPDPIVAKMHREEVREYWRYPTCARNSPSSAWCRRQHAGEFAAAIKSDMPSGRR